MTKPRPRKSKPQWQAISPADRELILWMFGDDEVDAILLMLPEAERARWSPVLRFGFPLQRDMMRRILPKLSPDEREFLADLFLTVLSLKERIDLMDEYVAMMEGPSQRMGWLGARDKDMEELIRRYVEGDGLTHEQIAKKLNAAGRMNTNGKKWTKAAIGERCRRGGFVKGKKRKLAEMEAKLIAKLATAEPAESPPPKKRKR